MTPTLHAAAWAICETSGPRCEALCPGCLEQARAAGKVWLEALSVTVKERTEASEKLGKKLPYSGDMFRGEVQAYEDIAAAIEALIGEIT